MKSFFSHDSNARNTSQLLAIRMKYGAEGYGIYFMILERLREEEDYTSVKDYNMIAFDLRVDTQKVKSIIEDFGLFAFTENGECFYSEGLKKRMQIKDGKSKTLSDAGKRGAEKRWENKDIDSHPNSQAIATPMRFDSNKSKVNKSKVNKSKVNKSKEKNNNTVVHEIIDFLNSQTQSNFKATTKETVSLINARLKDGYTLDDFKTVITKKTKEWLNNPDMSKFLRPSTLFGNKFESYLNQKEMEEKQNGEDRQHNNATRSGSTKTYGTILSD